ncbi:MAG: polyprenyl synthetase family protein [Syntrophomonadaceae bacterium]|jgi:heptaprenyl diphosphate synthase
MDFRFFNPIRKELKMVERNLVASIDTELPILEQASTHLLKAGGKRLRPAFALLAAKLYNDSLDKVIPVAVALELIHMASLVHDDVIDNSSTRRGAATVKSKWGNRVSIYAGDYILAKSLHLVAQYNRSDIVDVLALASMKICEGEIIQMLSCYNVKQSFKDYLRRIERKTALLISVSCQLGGMVSNAPDREIVVLTKYGYYLGMAFQVTDDILDFTADEKTLGKPVGSDIRQGVITLPALYALKYDSRREELEMLLASPELCISKADTIIDIVTKSQGIDYAYDVSRRYAEKAQHQLSLLPVAPVTKTLSEITDFILTRKF